MTPKNKEQIIFFKNKFLPLSKVSISPLDRGLLYGDGFFETILAQKNMIFFLHDHLDRIKKTSQNFGIKIPKKIMESKLFYDLLKKNKLEKKTVKIKIIVTRGDSTFKIGLPLTKVPTIIIFAEKYKKPSNLEYKEGWSLHIPKNKIPSPLAKYKSLNYLNYLKLKHLALEAKKNETIIIDHKGFICETTTGTLIVKEKNTWWTPYSRWQLPGITLKRLRLSLNEKKINIKNKIATIKDLLNVDNVWMLNSLLLAMPIRKIGNRTLPSINNNTTFLLHKILKKNALHCKHQRTPAIA